MTFRMKARRAGWLLVVAAFAFGIVSAVLPKHSQAYGLINTRYIKMSSSEASGAGGLGSNVIYSVGFNLATSGQTVGAIIIHFCSNDPIIGDACNAPAGLNTNFATTQLLNWSAGGGFTTAPTIDQTNSNANTIYLKRGAPGAVTGTPTITFDLGNGSTNGFTNPSTTNATFFARITIYSTINPSWSSSGDGLNGTNATTEKTAGDAGGVALSTANVLNVTAKVQEQLTFCLYTGANCAAGGSSINMGDSNGVLAATNTEYLDSSPKFDLASNALGGVVVRLKGDTLTSGAFTITADGDACTADLTTTSSEQFGLRVVTYGASQVAPSAGRYDCLAGNHMFGPLVTNTTYGDAFVKTTGATDVSTSNFELAAKAANTTEAGVYTTKLQFIATVTY